MNLHILFLLSFFWFSDNNEPIIVHQKDAVIWHPEQTITGELSDLESKEIKVYHNQDSFSVKVGADRHFRFRVIHKNKVNKIWITIPGGVPGRTSDTLMHTLGYDPKPIVKPVVAIHDKNKVVLKTEIIENPYNKSLKYIWKEDRSNPASSGITSISDSVAVVDIPEKNGKYYYNLLVVAEQDSSWFRALVERKNKAIDVYDINSEDTPWMNDAVIYQITPHAFVENGKFNDIIEKLPEIKELGANTIWLQPVFTSHHKGSQGYDVVDYLSVNPNLGNEQELRELIAVAKKLEMRVLFDVVLNHTSIHHPYALDRIANGKSSHYYDFYQHKNDGKPYSSFYDQDEHGFINYFWPHLVNLNYENEEVQRWMLEVCKYWVREFDIDGYRLDAIWGVNARKPSFAKRLRTELKSIKPELLLLAEAKGSDPEVFDLGYEAAYDWKPDTSWVSQWSWEYEYNEDKNMTVFNHPNEKKRTELLRIALFDNGGNFHKQLRTIENNDLPRFLTDHNLEQKKMASALLFAIPGLPMIYNGQEIGHKGHPYKTKEIFQRHLPIKAQDPYYLFPYYKKLIEIYNEYPALRDTTMAEIAVAEKDHMIALHRWNDNQDLLVVINLSGKERNATVELQAIKDKLPLNSYRLQDVFDYTTYQIKKKRSSVRIPMKGYSLRIMKISPQ